MLDIAIIIFLAGTTVGVMEYLKGFIPVDKRKVVPAWVYRLALLFVSIGVAFAKGGDINTVLINALSLVGVSQIGYASIVEKLKLKIKDK